MSFVCPSQNDNCCIWEDFVAGTETFYHYLSIKVGGFMTPSLNSSFLNQPFIFRWYFIKNLFYWMNRVVINCLRWFVKKKQKTKKRFIIRSVAIYQTNCQQFLKDKLAGQLFCQMTVCQHNLNDVKYAPI